MPDDDGQGADATPRDSFDALAGDLQALREQAGPVSYAELARRITTQRLARGIAPAAAAPPRSTVYSAFRQGRARLDPDLLRDIVVALGATDGEADAWVGRSRTIRASAPSRTTTGTPPADAPPMSTAPAEPLERSTTRRPSWRTVVLIMLGCVATNLLGLVLASFFTLTVYLDMVGTAIAAIALGPWHGVAVAIASNGLGFVTGDVATLDFIPVNVAGALIWGFGVRRFRAGTSLARFGILQLVAAVGCSLVATPIVAANFHGGEGHASELAMLRLAADLPFLASVLLPNLVTSVVDKLLTGFLALLAIAVLHRTLRLPIDRVPIIGRLTAPASAGPR